MPRVRRAISQYTGRGILHQDHGGQINLTSCTPSPQTQVHTRQEDALSRQQRRHIYHWRLCQPMTLTFDPNDLKTSLPRPEQSSSVQSEPKIPPCGAACGFQTFFDKRLRILNQFFTHLLHVPIYARLQIFIHLSQTLTKLCLIKCDYLVHVICAKCPPSAETRAFRRLRPRQITIK